MATPERPARAEVDAGSAALPRFAAALAFSTYAARVAAASPALLEDKTFDPRRPLTRQAMLDFLQGAEADTASAGSSRDEAALRRNLRRLRAGSLLALMQRDLDGSADLAEITSAMTALAEVALTCTISWFDRAMRAEFGVPRGESSGAPQSLLAVGMGKLGGGELNVSSDIDLVLLYAEEGETDGTRSIANHEYFVRLGQRVIRALDDVTADGRVFRVDMRLRPNGDAGPLACGFDMLEQYFVTQGREWERYAWIKARVVNAADDQGLARVVRPFVYRKYLDFGAFAAMRALHAQIRAEVARRELADHIKLGPGGIREIEFIAQVFQLLRGGREPALQLQPTLAVLDALAARSLLPAAAAGELAAAYRFLRRLEHRLQYLDDRQTHELPQPPPAQMLVAKAMGEADYAALLTKLERHRALVSRQFEAIFAERDSQAHPLAALWSGEMQAIAGGLAAAGYAEAAVSAARLVATRSGARYRSLGEAARIRFDRLVPRAIALAAATDHPDAALARMLDFLEAICRRSAYLALLDESQQALERVAGMLAASQWAAQYLTRNPLLLDELLDPRTLDHEPGGAAFERDLRIQLLQFSAADPAAADTERQMDILREMHHAQLFRLLARDLAGLLSVERLADLVSDIADRVLQVALELCWNLVRGKLDAVLPAIPRFAVIAYGKLGGKELGYASDLDLVFLYEGDPQHAQDAYSRLGQRLVTWLTSTTPAGMLFEVDLRLRPYGDSGLLVSHLDAFREYQTQHAWIWEHQALTRARCCAGDTALGREFETTRRGILMRERELAPLAREITAMRDKMHAAHPNRSGSFDLKHDTGGMIDIEFAVQFLVLAHAHRHAELTANIGNIALLGLAGRLRLVDPELAGRVQDAYREYRRRQHALRLNGAQFARVPRGEIEAPRASVVELWQRVLGTAASAGSPAAPDSDQEE
jgi:[glutamine synthetase] adenylyltransferase / [glutamine synthetase]-adenylyl-L-tyrosine phosphorylase